MPDRRRPARIAGAALIAAAASAMLLPANAATPKVPQLVGDQPPASITLASLEPAAPQPGDTVRLRGTITNTSTTTISDLSLELYFDPNYIETRSAFDEYADTPDSDSFGALFPQPQAQVSLGHQTLAAGASEPWSITIPVNDLPLSQSSWEVYQLGVAASDGDTTVGRLRTFLPYAPLAAGVGTTPLHVGWIWPLVDSPHRNLTTAGSSFIDDDLAGEVAVGGRLQRLLAAANSAADQRRKANKHHPLAVRPVSVTYAIDPELVDDVEHMTTGYTVDAPGEKPTTGTGKAAATAWLAQLRSATMTEPVLPLPYGNPDIDAAIRSGQRAIVQDASTIGSNVISQDLPAADVLQGWLWPPGGLISPNALDAEYDAQNTDIVLSQQALPELVQPNATPDAHVQVPTRDNDVTGLLTDDTLSTEVTKGATTDSGEALERYLAETLMIYAEAPSPSKPRSIVIAPTTDWAPGAGYANALLADTGKVPWLRSTSLTDAAQAPITADVSTALHYPGLARQQELSGGYVQSIANINVQVSQLRDILGSVGATEIDTDDKAVLSALSATWRGRAEPAEAYETQLAKTISATVGRVRIAAGQRSNVTLTSHTGSIPITVENDLDLPVSVRVALDAGPRLSASTQRIYRIPAHERVALPIKVVAQTSGIIPLHVQLRAGGRAYGPLVRIYVHSTAYGAVALLITALAFAVLLVAVIVRLSRRALRARRTAGEPVGVDG